MRLLLYLEIKHQKGSLHISSCRFSAVYNRLVSHSEALDKPRYVVDQLIATREYLVSKETFKLEEPSGFHISTTEDVSVRVLMVYKNSVIFNAFGAVAADKFWSMEGDIVELLESAFPEDHMRGARFA